MSANIYEMGILPPGYTVHHDPLAGTVTVEGDGEVRVATFAVEIDDSIDLDANTEANKARYVSLVEDLADAIYYEDEDGEV